MVRTNRNSHSNCDDTGSDDDPTMMIPINGSIGCNAIQHKNKMHREGDDDDHDDEP